MKYICRIFRSKYLLEIQFRIYSILQKKVVIASYLIGIFIIPPIAIRFEWIPVTKTTNFITLFICTMLCIIIMCIERWGKSDWDLKPKDEIKMLLPYTIFTVVGILALIIVKEISHLKFDRSWIEKDHFRYLFIPLSFLQVVSYRTFLFKKLELFTKNEKQLVLLSTIFYTVMHIMFSNIFIIICFVGGLAFGFMYLKYRSLKLMTGSHSSLNFTAAICGAFTT